MKQLKACFILSCFVCLFSPLYAASEQKEVSPILTCTSITEVEQYLEPNVLCAVDLDNTIVECVNEHEGEQWFSAAIKYLTTTIGLPQKQASEKIIRYFHKIHETASLKPVEDQKTMSFIHDLAKKNIPTLAITSRSIIVQTFREFNEINLSFDAFHIPNTPHVFSLPAQPAYYLHGILFCGNNKKGEALAAFLKTTGMKPSKVILLDDKREHLESVQEVLKILNIPFLGLHYTYLANKVSHYVFDPHTIAKLALTK